MVTYRLEQYEGISEQTPENYGSPVTSARYVDSTKSKKVYHGRRYKKPYGRSYSKRGKKKGSLKNKILYAGIDESNGRPEGSMRKCEELDSMMVGEFCRVTNIKKVRDVPLTCRSANGKRSKDAAIKFWGTLDEFGFVCDNARQGPLEEGDKCGSGHGFCGDELRCALGLAIVPGNGMKKKSFHYCSPAKSTMGWMKNVAEGKPCYTNYQCESMSCIGANKLQQIEGKCGKPRSEGERCNFRGNYEKCEAGTECRRGSWHASYCAPNGSIWQEGVKNGNPCHEDKQCASNNCLGGKGKSTSAPGECAAA